MTHVTNNFQLSRRGFLRASAVSAAMLGSTKSSSATPNTDQFPYEVIRTEEEWRRKLSKSEYNVLRKGSTELPKSSPLWNSVTPGQYDCKGCELNSYQGNWKVQLDKGWVFFKHSEPNAVMLGIDGPVAEYGSMASGPGAFIEVHCRRCGSHLGHIVNVEGQMLHCINGSSLKFTAA